VQMICMWSSWCHCHPINSFFVKIQTSLTFLVLAYPILMEKSLLTKTRWAYKHKQFVFSKPHSAAWAKVR